MSRLFGRRGMCGATLMVDHSIELEDLGQLATLPVSPGLDTPRERRYQHCLALAVERGHAVPRSYEQQLRERGRSADAAYMERSRRCTLSWKRRPSATTRRVKTMRSRRCSA